MKAAIEKQAKKEGIDTSQILNAKTGAALYWAVESYYKDYIDKHKLGQKIDKKTGKKFRADMYASSVFNQFGVPGQRYLDGNNRASKYGTYNMVIWDVDTLKILGLIDDSDDDAKEYFERTKAEQDNRDNSENYNQIVGIKGARELDKLEGTTRRIDALKIARDMKKEKLSDNVIWLATSWQRGVDKEWRMELPDVDKNIHTFIKEKFADKNITPLENELDNIREQRKIAYIKYSLLELLDSINFSQSLSNTACPYDNAGVESFFKFLKKEEISK